MEPKLDQTAFRATLGLLGLVTGLALWSLDTFVITQLGAPRLELAISAAALGFFSATLMMSGPMLIGRAMAWACLMATLPAALLLWASFRYVSVEALADDPIVLLAFAILLTVPLPFLIAADRGMPRDYPTLFNESWRLVIRAAAAAVFLGVFWGVYFICSLLLSLVGVTLLDRLVDQAPFVFGLSGLVIGLALAVLYEMRRYLSPLLLLRLLQLLLVPVTAVVVVFVVRVPLEGLDQVFSGLSAAATLLAMTFGLATLVTSALDCEPSEAGLTWLLRWTVQLACCLMPVLAGLGAYAVWLRVAQYGWTPERVAAACICAVALTYALLYFWAVVRRGNWDPRIRQGNIHAALIGIALAAASLSPLLNPQRIAAQSQLALFSAGQTDATQLPVRDMARDWGVAGQAALETLRAQADRDLQILLDDALRESATPVALETPEEQRAALARLLPLMPAGASWPEPLWDALDADQIATWLAACRAGPDSCVAVIGESAPDLPGDEAIVLLVQGARFVSATMVGLDAAGEPVNYVTRRQTSDEARELVRATRQGDYTLEVPRRRGLVIGATRLFPSGD
ncbi:DUF4153 domain-containing protein [Dinoroseobacter sp. PD6]|uniref:DUF4153 domain-containing protein n=1 Tax=Dinoroseobacter sp. PD6 TaxID=3028384 RepID=UPI00237C2651|nr:DUF4153 domain-containing protein [Dinoroseobacter sp. PD6]MDD9717009.1 DUF4153 domain-containing protein [Dinoroseobacter sp. PD6]